MIILGVNGCLCLMFCIRICTKEPDDVKDPDWTWIKDWDPNADTKERRGSKKLSNRSAPVELSASRESDIAKREQRKNERK